MRRIAVLFCVIATLFSISGCKKDYTHGVYEVTITASIISNNSVGNDWQKTYTSEGRTIASGEQWTVPLDTTKTLTINATVTESDEWPESGSASLRIILKDGFETSTTITVTENKGRYKGNKAQWKITCKAQLVKKLEQK